MDSENIPGQVVRHSAVDGLDVFVHIAVIQLALRQDQPQGGRGVAGDSVRFLPVFRLAGELVAGNYRPPAHVRAGSGQQNVCRADAQLLKTLVHSCSSFKYVLYQRAVGKRRITLLFPALAARRRVGGGFPQCHMSGRITILSSQTAGPAEHSPPSRRDRHFRRVRRRRRPGPYPGGCRRAGRAPGPLRGPGWRSGSYGR